jgi:phenylalanyl-tRNA synthetase beta chain
MALTHSGAEDRAELILKAKRALAAMGLQETLNFAFTSRTWLKEFGLESGVRVLNPLSEEHEILVPSLIPGAVQNVLHNQRHHFGSEQLALRLFELRPTFHASGAVGATDESTTGVVEKWKLTIALSGPRWAGGLRNELGEVDFYDLKAVWESMLDQLGTRGVRLQSLSQSREAFPLLHLFHPGQSVEILTGNQVAGVMGLVHPAQARKWKLRAPLWLLEVDWDSIAKLSRGAYEAHAFQKWSDFPPMERDFALLIQEGVTADKITQLAMKAARPLAKTAKVFDIYKGAQVAQGMTSVAVRVIFSEEGRSLQEAEVEAASQKILDVWKKELGIELRA